MEKINFQDLPSTTTPLNSANLNQMQDNMEDAIIPIKLVTIRDSAPSSATTGDMYYNTTDNKVYMATGTNTWDSGSTPRYDGFYINTSDNTLFYYNGTALVGAGGSQTSINVKNEKTTSETDVYSCNYINNMHPNIVTDGSPVKTGRKVGGKDEYVKRITLTSFPNATTKTFQTGITNAKWVRHYIYMYIPASNVWYLLPYHSLSALNAGVNATVSDDASEINIQAGTDRSSLNGVAEIYFTYNS